MRRMFVNVAALFVMALAFSTQVKAADDILIGLHGPLTGPASWIGLGGRDGALLAMDEINAAGGFHGRKLKLVSYDDANNPSEAETVTKKMIDGDKVFAILGAGASNTAVVVAQEAMRAKVPYLNSTAASPKIIDSKSRWIFSAGTIDVRDISENEAAFIAKYLKVKNYALLHSADEFSQTYTDALIKILKDNYGIDILKREKYNRGDTEFSSQIISVRRAAPELLLLSGPYIENARIIRQARELGIKIPIKGDTSSMNSGLLTIAGRAAEGAYVSYALPYFNGDPDPNMVKFEARYKHAYPGYPVDRPNYVDVYLYGCMYALAEGLKRAGPDLTPKGFVEAMETLDNFNASDGWPQAVNVIQPTTFTTSHSGNRKMSHFVVKSGAFTRVTDFVAPLPSTAFPANNTLEW